METRRIANRLGSPAVLIHAKIGTENPVPVPKQVLLRQGSGQVTSYTNPLLDKIALNALLLFLDQIPFRRLSVEMNINEDVWVRLTKDGEEIYKKHYEVGLGVVPIHREEIFGWSRFPMWRLMQIFGSSFHTGGSALFENNMVRFSPPTR